MRLFWMAVVLVGALAGYLVSSGLGTRLLHDEIEVQLTRLLEGPVSIGSVAVRFEDGLRIEARDVSAYPGVSGGGGSAPAPAGPGAERPGAAAAPADASSASGVVVSPRRADGPAALRARRILAWVDLLSLLIGRLELSTLVLEGPHLRLVQNADGSFVGLPIPAPSSYPDEGLDDRAPAEQVFARIAALDIEAERIAAGFRAADRIEIVDGTIEWIGPPSVDADPTRVRVELLNGAAERHWLSEDIAIDWRGVFVDGVHSPFPFEIGAHREAGAHWAWTLSLARIPLAAAESPLGRPEGLTDVDGTLDVRFRLHSDDDGRHQLSVDGSIDDARVTLRRSGKKLAYPRVQLEAELVVDPVAVRLVSASMTGQNLALAFQGSIGRPVRPASRVRIESRTQGLDLAGVRDYARTLEDESSTALTVSRLTERVESGRIRYIEVAGTARLDRWSDLFSGRSSELPAGFLLGGAFENVRVESGEGEYLEDLSGEVEWIDDQVVFRNGRGRYRGEPLPILNAVLDGISHLTRTAAEARVVGQTPPPLPGLDPLFEILRPRDPDSLPPVKAVGLALDHLEHPVFRWPLRDLRVLIEPLRRGVEITVRKGVWGGAAVTGELVWFSDPDRPSVSASLVLGPADPPEDPEAFAEKRAAARAAGVWGEGLFELSFRPRAFLPFENATGVARVEGTRLFMDDLEIRIANQGTIAARLAVDFDAADTIGFDTSFALMDARLQEIGPFVALPPDLARGAIEAAGTLAGRVRPDTSFIAELEGRVRADARDGLVKTTLPLMFRLAKATEGYNPFAGQDQLQFETMGGSFVIDTGTISVADFEIEGPLRVFARADIDTVATPADIRAVVGIFLFRQPNALLDSLPLIRAFLPGSERGLIGTYFEVDGPLSEPDIDALPLQSLLTSVPDVIKAPFQVLGRLFEGGPDEGDGS